MMIRCFIAIELDEDVRSRIELLQGQLRRQLRGKDKGLKWVKSGSIHLTLKFLGEIEDKYIPDICSALSETVEEFSAFDFDIDRLGTFPENGPARVLWLGIGQGSEQLAGLQDKIDQRLADLGIEPEGKKFVAHLTLARIKNSDTGRELKEIVAGDISMDIGIQDVCEVRIIQSVSGKEGPSYVPVHTAKLK
ncbi:MAG: RNA 2',3'-cyclic phosphodiesterase [Phycisphaerae bacterium]|nr:RNA 2',3'-cyclic phosphodiesterase [Phycisphaerae bacterium]